MSHTEGDSNRKVSTISLFTDLWILYLTVAVIEDGVQSSVPAGCGGHLKEEDERLEKRLEIVNIIEAGSDLDIFEKTHSEDGQDEHDQEEKKTNVEKSWEGHNQGEQECSDSPRTFDQSENSANLDDPDHPQEGRGDEIFLNEVAEEETGQGHHHHAEVEEVPWLGEVVVSQGEHLHQHFRREDDNEPEQLVSQLIIIIKY